MQQIAIVLAIFILLGACGKTASKATYNMRVCAEVIYDYRGVGPDCSVPKVHRTVG